LYLGAGRYLGDHHRLWYTQLCLHAEKDSSTEIFRRIKLILRLLLMKQYIKLEGELTNWKLQDTSIFVEGTVKLIFHEVVV
jgi:hypothetical protein